MTTSVYVSTHFILEVFAEMHFRFPKPLLPCFHLVVILQACLGPGLESSCANLLEVFFLGCSWALWMEDCFQDNQD